MPANNKSFLGTGWAFPPTFKRETSGVEMVSDLDDIVQSIQIILGTAPGERVMQPNFGSNMERLLFEPLDNSLRAYMSDLVTDTLLFHEPRINLNSVELTALPLEGRVDISIDFTVRSTNKRSNIVYPFYLNEGANS
ncbi:MAG: GPW/gp25 family protein [Salibacteraceae bacterium]